VPLPCRPLLMPGVADSRTLADATDFRVKQTQQSGLSFNGSNGRGNSVTVEGGEANDPAGGVRLTLSQDAIQEFQINRSNYSAELGPQRCEHQHCFQIRLQPIPRHSLCILSQRRFGCAGPICIRTCIEAGRPVLADSEGPASETASESPQFGAAAGFPIRKHKTFLFVSYEGLRRDESASVPLLTDTSIFAPSARQTAILNGLRALGSGVTVPCITNSPNPPISLPADACAVTLAGLLTVNPAFSPSKCS